MKAWWDEKTLGELCDIARGGSPRPIQSYLTTDPKGVNWIKISDATASGKYIFRTEQKIRTEGVSRSRMVKEGDFLLSNSMSFGRPYIMKTSGCIHDGWLVLSDKSGLFEQDFLYHFLGSQAAFKQFDSLAAGSTVRNLNIDLAKKVRVPIPPLPEQRRIVSILDEAFAGLEAMRANAEKNLQNARELFEHCVSATFSRGGEGWIATTVGEQITLQRGFDITKDQQKPGNVPVVSSGGIKSFHNTAMVKGPGVIIGRKGTLGKAFYLQEDFWPHDTTLWVKDFKGNQPLFVFYFLANLKVQHLDSGAANPALNRNQVHPIKTLWPPPDVQQRLASTFYELSERSKALEEIYRQKLAAIDELKQSILQKAFAGELTATEAVAA